MLTVVKNQLKILFLSVKYNLMREMTNKVSFCTNILFMILNNSTFVIQWLLLFHLKEDIGGYALSDVLMLWGLSAGTYGLSHIFFQRAYSLPDLILHGKLDSFLVQPKNVLLGIISSATNTSAIGDLIYGYIIICVFRFSIRNLLLFTIFLILGSIIMTAFAIITGSISFWIVRGDMLAENLNNTVTNFSIYPETIFKNAIRLLLYTLIPVGFIIYLPLKIMLEFNLLFFVGIILFTLGISSFAFYLFYKGLKRYTSSSLMSARI